MIPRVAIVGRPNVGKSTLFNRLIGKRRSITLDTPGITRDLITEPVRWDGRKFLLIDTGGLRGEAVIELAEKVHEHTMKGIETADVLVVLLDAKTGLNPLDAETVELVQRAGADVIFCANKADGAAREANAYEFCELGIEPPLTISAEHGLGIDDLQRAILERVDPLLAAEAERIAAEEEAAAVAARAAEALSEADNEDPEDRVNEDRASEDAPEANTNGTAEISGTIDDGDLANAATEEGDTAEDGDIDAGLIEAGEIEAGAEDAPGEKRTKPSAPKPPRGPGLCRVALIGRPNVGKSSMLNLVAGEELSLVDDTPGTTRDIIDTRFRRDGREYLFVDTAGVRRRGKVEYGAEHLSVRRSFQAVERADVVALLIEPEEGLTDQDARLARRAWDDGKALVILINKMDMVRSGARRRALEEETWRRAPTLRPALLEMISVLEEEGIDRAFAAINAAADAHDRRLPTGDLNRLLGDIQDRRQPPVLGRGRLKLLYGTQTGQRPPRVSIFVNRTGVPTDYRRFVERCLRETYPLRGTPLQLKFPCRDSHSDRDKP